MAIFHVSLKLTVDWFIWFDTKILEQNYTQFTDIFKFS